MFSLICAWINGWVHNGEAGDLRRHRAHYDATVMGNANTPALNPVRFVPYSNLAYQGQLSSCMYRQMSVVWSEWRFPIKINPNYHHGHKGTFEVEALVTPGVLMSPNKDISAGPWRSTATLLLVGVHWRIASLGGCQMTPIWWHWITMCIRRSVSAVSCID